MMRLVDYKDENAGPAFDLSGIIMHECICGSDMWRLVVSFQDYEIATYLLDMECFYCGTRATAPTPIDNPEYEENND
jgi:hypothetical protein